MYKLVHKIFLLFFSGIMSFSVLAMDDFPGALPPASDEETLELARTYRNLCTSYNQNNSIEHFNHVYEEFENAIFFPVEQKSSNPNDPNSYDPNTFLTRAIGTRDKIQAEIDNPRLEVLSTLLEENIMPLLSNRIDVARLDQNIFQRWGTRGSLDIFYNAHLKEALEWLTGRIFQVDIKQNELVSASSAIMISWNETTHQIRDLNRPRYLNSILTCAHAINSKDGRSNFYFVQSAHLDLSSGFPRGITSLSGEGGLIDFLQNDFHSFRMRDFTIRNRDNNDFTTINLTMGNPQNFPHEDLLVGHIALRPPLRRYPLYNINCHVSFQATSFTGYPYFALGYPGCDHYKREGYPQLVQDRGLSPLFITRSQWTSQAPVKFYKKGFVTHRSPTAAGMSGGPLFHLKNGRLNIFGVITAGKDNKEIGCHWF